MPKNVELIRIMVAAPADVQPERAALNEAVRRLNLMWGDNQGVRLEIVGWDTHSFPDFSTDPQAVINAQLPADYDVFVGIMWARVGTPTPRAESGTIEEFERALARYREEPGLVGLMLYFKDEPIAMAADLTQAAAVKAFREGISKEGGLYAVFRTTDDFQDLIELQLTAVVTRLLRLRNESTRKDIPERRQDSTDLATTQAGDEEADEGMLDLFELANDQMTQATASLGRLGEALETLTARTRERVVEVNKARSDSIVVQKRVTNRAAEDMDQFVARASAEIPILADSLQGGIRALGRAVPLMADLGSNGVVQLVDLRAQSGGLANEMISASETFNELRATISTLPRLTGHLIKARRRTLSVIDQFLRETGSGVNLVREMEKAIDEILVPILERAQ